jgi:hypothetical protein
MHLQPVFRDCEFVGGGVAEALFRDGLCLPSGTALAAADLARVLSLMARLCGASCTCGMVQTCGLPNSGKGNDFFGLWRLVVGREHAAQKPPSPIDPFRKPAA